MESRNLPDTVSDSALLELAPSEGALDLASPKGVKFANPLEVLETPGNEGG